MFPDNSHQRYVALTSDGIITWKGYAGKIGKLRLFPAESSGIQWFPAISGTFKLAINSLSNRFLHYLPVAKHGNNRSGSEQNPICFYNK